MLRSYIRMLGVSVFGVVTATGTIVGAALWTANTFRQIGIGLILVSLASLAILQYRIWRNTELERKRLEADPGYAITANAVERERRRRVVEGLATKWQMEAGLDRLTRGLGPTGAEPPMDWLNEQLRRLGELWEV